MNQLTVLEKIENNQLSANQALKQLYPVKRFKPGKRAFFIKMSIKVPKEGKKLNTFLKILFAIPIPIMFARIGMRLTQRFVKIDEIDMKEISNLLKYSRNTRVQVDTEDAQVDIRIV